MNSPKITTRNVSSSGLSEEHVLHVAGPLDPEEGVRDEGPNKGEGDAQTYHQHFAHSEFIKICITSKEREVLYLVEVM